MSFDRERLFELTAVNRAILGAEDLGEVLRLLAATTLRFMDADASVVLLTGADGLARVAASALDERIGDALRAWLRLREEDALVAAPLVGSRMVLGVLAACRRVAGEQ